MQHKPKNESSCYRCFSVTQIILLQLNFSPSFWSLQRPIWCELFIFQSSCFVERVATRFIRNAWLSTIGYFDRARSRCKHSASFKTVNMQNKHGSSIRSCDCYLKRCVKKTVRRSTVFMWWNLGFPMIALLIFIGLLRLKKEVSRKENTVEKIAKRRQIRKSPYAQTPISAKFHSITYCFAAKKIGIFRVRLIAFPIIEFPKLCWTVKHNMFHSITYCFAAKKIGIFRVRLIAFPIIEFPKLCWTVKHICALPSACW